MIYKFRDSDISMEIEQCGESTISIYIHEENEDFRAISLDKKDVYKLIGALHLLHKELV